MVIYELDLEQDSQLITSAKPTTAFDFQLGATPTPDFDDDPIRVPYQGLWFSKGKFVQSLNTPSVSIPQIFTVEAWVRFDLDNPGSYGDLQYIYEVQRNTQKFAIALDNTYMKVIINGNEVTLYSEWLKSSAWRYIAVTVIKSYVDASTPGGSEIA